MLILNHKREDTGMLEVVGARRIASLGILSCDLEMRERWLLLVRVAFVAILSALLIRSIVRIVLEVITEFNDLGALLDDNMVLLTMITLTRVTLSLRAARGPALIATALLTAVLTRGTIALAVLGGLHALPTFFLLAFAVRVVLVCTEHLGHHLLIAGLAAIGVDRAILSAKVTEIRVRRSIATPVSTPLGDKDSFAVDFYAISSIFGFFLGLRTTFSISGYSEGLTRRLLAGSLLGERPRQ